MNIVKNCIKCKKKKFNILIEWPQIKSRAFILHSSLEISVSWWLGIKPWFPAISHKFYERRLLRNRQVFRGILWSIAVMWQKISQNSLMSCQRRVYLPPREVRIVQIVPTGDECSAILSEDPLSSPSMTRHRNSRHPHTFTCFCLLLNFEKYFFFTAESNKSLLHACMQFLNKKLRYGLIISVFLGF